MRQAGSPQVEDDLRSVMSKLTLAAVLDGYSRRKDRSVSIRFHTQELTSQGVMEIDSMCDSFGILYFRPGEKLNADEIAELDKVDLTDFDNPKSQSQRLRAVLYKLHQQEASTMQFRDYYQQQTEKIINHFKSKLDE